MNKDLQLLAAGKGIKQWQIAKEIGIREETLCRWFRNELDLERKEQIIAAIDRLSKDKESKV